VIGAVAAVHTVGINWESIGVIAAIVGVGFSIVVWITARRDARSQLRNEDIKNEINVSVNHLSDVLLARLETKETVARISERLARLEGAAGIPDGRGFHAHDSQAG
jgi:hypothetical protein